MIVAYTMTFLIFAALVFNIGRFIFFLHKMNAQKQKKATL